MSTRRARERERGAAIRLVEAACAAGRIVPADRDRRVEELRRAQSPTEIYLLTQDLRVTGASPPAMFPPPATFQPPPGVATSGQPWPTLAEVTRMGPGGAPRASRGALLAIPIAVVLVFVAGLAGLALIGRAAQQGGAPQASASAISIPSPTGDVLTAAGYDELVAAVAAETGSTMVVDALLDPASAYVETRSGTRTASWSWDGTTLTAGSGVGVPDRPEVDLRTVTGATLMEVVDHAKSLVDQPTGWTAFVEAPDLNGVVIVAAASHGHDGVYVSARADGTVVRTTQGH